MVEKKINLTTNDILEKEFKSGLRGYNQEEVDKFLDLVIKDYEMFHAQLDALKKENEKLKKQVEEPKVKVTPVAPPTPTQFTNTNPDILRRLSNLEKHVFGSKLYD